MTESKKNYYLSKFKNKLFVVKIGGEVVASKTVLETILKDVVELFDDGIKILLVHGGGAQADAISKQLGHSPTKIDGRRVTTQQDLEIAKMLFGGSLNLEILGILKKIGAKGIRVSGADGSLLNVKLRDKAKFDFGFVGDIVSVDTDILHLLLDKHYLPVISPIATTNDGTIVNINADTVAAELAVAVKAEKLILLTQVDGVSDGKKHFSQLEVEDAERMIDEKIITGGMIVKVKNALYAVQNGVHRAHILNAFSPHSLLKEVLTKKGVGTMIMSEKEKSIYLHE